MKEGTAAFLVAGLAAAAALPFCTYALTLPVWASLVVAAAVFAIFYLVLHPRRFDLQLDEMNEAEAETVEALLSEGLDALDRLRAAGEATTDVSMRKAVHGLCAAADKIIARLRDQPARAMAMRRFLSFYLPNAASIAEGWLTLEGNRRPSPERVTQTRQVMASLNGAFAKFENDADRPELQELDVDLKLVKDALKSDLEGG